MPKLSLVLGPKSFLETDDPRVVLVSMKCSIGCWVEMVLNPVTWFPPSAGVFMMVAGGIIAGVLLIFVEIAYKRHRGLKEKELELAKTAADRWRGNIEVPTVLALVLIQNKRSLPDNPLCYHYIWYSHNTFSHSCDLTCYRITVGHARYKWLMMKCFCSAISTPA